jgi:hypothetical protein
MRGTGGYQWGKPGTHIGDVEKWNSVSPLKIEGGQGISNDPRLSWKLEPTSVLGTIATPSLWLDAP